MKREAKINIDQRKTETIYRNGDFTGNTMALNSYPSIVTLNVNGLNDPVKRHRVSDWIKRARLIYLYAVYKRLILGLRKNERVENHLPCKWSSKESWSSNPHIR